MNDEKIDKSENKIELIRKLLSKASSNIAQVKKLLSESDNIDVESQIMSKAEEFKEDDEEDVVKGVFDGKHMIDANGKQYPVPENYASKSKLVQGDQLKLTIDKDGSYIYKQIGPVDRKNLTATLVEDEDQYKAVAENGKTYNVLTASVTYYKLKEGDEMTITIPADEESNWAAIESAVINN